MTFVNGVLDGYSPMGIRRLFYLALALFAVWGSAASADVDGLWDFDQPAESEARFQAAFDQAKDNASRSEILTQLARAQGLQGRFADGNRTLDLLQDKLTDLPPTVSIRYTLERGRLLNSSGEAKKAQRWFRSAYLLAQKHNEDFYAIDAMHMLAITEQGAAALEWNDKALKLAETSSQPRAADWKGSLYNNIGWTYYDQGDYRKSLDYLRRAMSWHEARKSGKQLLMARWAVGKLLRLTGDPGPGLLLQLEVEKAQRERLEPDGAVYEEIAEDLVELGRREDAKQYFAYAYRLLSQDPAIVKAERPRLERLLSMSK